MTPALARMRSPGDSDAATTISRRHQWLIDEAELIARAPMSTPAPEQ